MTASLVIPYNIVMSTENDKAVPIEAEQSASPLPESPPPSLSPELLAVGRGEKPAWKSGGNLGRWATIGCGLGIVVLVAALFAGSSLMRKTVWAGFAGTSRRVVANLPGDLQPGERMRLIGNLDAFAAYLKDQHEPFPIMGEFQDLARKMLEDRLISRDEVEELNVFLEAQLGSGSRDVPYSMP
jgi:hypothetical protein